MIHCDYSINICFGYSIYIRLCYPFYICLCYSIYIRFGYSLYIHLRGGFIVKKHIVCFGDSNTHGYCTKTNGRFSEDERWTSLLGRYLGDDYLICEEGLSGRTTVFEDPLFEGLNGLSAIFQSLMTHEPVDLLILMLGTNDTKERFSSNAENIAKGMERLTRKALSVTDAWHHGPRILLIAPAPIEEGYETTFIADEMGKGCVEKSRALALYYEDIAKRLGIYFLDASTIPGIQMHPKDHMHLDLNSHMLLAKKLASLIPDML